MSQINADFNQSGNSVFENVYIHGILDYDFGADNHTFSSIQVTGKGTFSTVETKDLIVTNQANFNAASIFNGISTFTSGIHLNDWIYHYDDLDTKFGFPDNDDFSVHTDGEERFRITPIGSVGIGTSNPEATLDVRGTEIVSTSIGIATRTAGKELDVVGSGRFLDDNDLDGIPPSESTSPEELAKCILTRLNEKFLMGSVSIIDGGYTAQ